MRAITVVFLVSILSLACAYDINAILKALSLDYDVENGQFEVFNVSNCEYTPSCFGNNPQSPYVFYNFESWSNATTNSSGANFGNLASDEAIVVLQAAPPTCRYFGFTPYIFTRNSTTVLFASLSDTLNMDTVNIGKDGTIAIVSSPNPNVTTAVINILNQYLLPNSVNALPLPGQLLNLGYEAEADTFAYLERFALFNDSAAGKAYLQNIPGYVFKLTPITPDNSELFPYPTYRPYASTTDNENFLQQSLQQLVTAIKAQQNGIGLVVPGIDVEHLAGYQNGFTCINRSRNCNGDNRDARYIRGSGMDIKNESNSYVWVAGVQHQLTGHATYIAVAAYDEDKLLGVLSVADTEMAGSAEIFLPNDPQASYLYALKFARSCDADEQFCYVIPVDFPGVPLGSPVSFTERIYVQPSSEVAPPYGSILDPQFIRYDVFDA